MVIEQRRSNKKLIISIIIVIVVLAGLAGAGYWFMQELKKKQTPVTESVSAEGTAICLPHKDGGEAHTLECGIGFKTTDGTLYGISNDKDMTLSSAAGSNQVFFVNGSIQPAQDSKYDVDKTISVESAEKR